MKLWFFRGNTPFCSNECRQEQIEIDESKEKSWKISTKRGVNRNSETNQNSSNNKAVRSESVAVAWLKSHDMSGVNECKFLKKNYEVEN